MKTQTLLLTLLILSAFSSPLRADTVHILQKNETLYSVARKYDISVDELIERNNITDVHSLRVGMEIVVKVDEKTGHRVEKGETLFGIARKYDISLNDLLEANKIDRNYLLKTGDLLLIPGGEAEEEPPKEEAEPQENDVEIAEINSLGNEKDWPIIGVPVPTEGKLSGVYIEGNTGDPVRTISSGTVVWVGPYRGFGKVVLIQSLDRYVYVYGGNSEIEVEVGQEVTPGMVISKLGINPHSQKPELFFSVFRNGKPVDPEHAPRS